jgi:PEP-CTERM motif
MNQNHLLAAACALAFAVAAAAASSAGATTYTGVRTFAGETVDLSITTDGAIGILQQSDVTSWNIDITDGSGSFDLTPTNSQFLLLDPADLTATASALSFNFSDNNSIAIWQGPIISSSGPLYCLDATAAGDCLGQGFPAEIASSVGGPSATSFAVMEQTGNQVIATTGVPEPETWALMLLGFAGLGAVLRQRANVVSV